MTYDLKIYRGALQVNALRESDPLEVLKTFARVLMDRRFNKTRVSKMPYKDKVQVTQYFDVGGEKYRYAYVFRGVCQNRELED
jgi:hypothetical protein